MEDEKKVEIAESKDFFIQCVTISFLQPCYLIRRVEDRQIFCKKARREEPTDYHSHVTFSSMIPQR